ncbi:MULTISPECIES: stalk domain-containing protein [unclassified Paenibacillus]|uniref:stalk domain-containing protein n=1 Tax=unclassified Paenibacillus TaxID=185978 RepID=UPI00362C8ABB
MFKSKWKYSTLGLLCALAIGNTANAEREFFWSDAVPLQSCYQNRDGIPQKMGIETNGKRIEVELPSCEEVKKNQVMVLVNGRYLHLIDSGAVPFIENGRTMVPLRAIADGFGFEVSWEQSQEKITLTKDGKSFIMHIGKSDILVDGEKVQLEEVVPMIKNNVTFLPVRQLAEILGIQVKWDGNTRTATFK